MHIALRTSVDAASGPWSHAQRLEERMLSREVSQPGLLGWTNRRRRGPRADSSQSWLERTSRMSSLAATYGRSTRRCGFGRPLLAVSQRKLPDPRILAACLLAIPPCAMARRNETHRERRHAKGAAANDAPPILLRHWHPAKSTSRQSSPVYGLWFAGSCKEPGWGSASVEFYWGSAMAG